MAYTTINKSTDYFNTKLYTGTGATHSITGVGHQPDMVWVKDRGRTGYNHCIADAVRGATKLLRPNLTANENSPGTYLDSLTSFDSDGFTLGADTSNGEHNINSQTYVSWNWKANGASSSNTDGTITSTVSANTTSGFSIVSYTGTGSDSDSVGHGLSKTPGMIFVKRRDSSADWRVWHQNLSATTGISLRLNTTDAEDSNISFFYSQPPNATTFRPGSGGNINASGGTYIAYCFAEKQGYSKFGSYTGNGNADGTFVYTGFKPAFILYKNISPVSENWEIHDTKRNPSNLSNKIFYANQNTAEATTDRIDILSNGFKSRTANSACNGSGNKIIYMAFAEAPLVGTNGVTAKAR